MASSVTAICSPRSRVFTLLVANLLILSVLCSSDRRFHSIKSRSIISISTSRSLFGVRGGGFFGFGKRSRKGSNGSGGNDDDDDDPLKRRKYPGLSRNEIEEKLNIPIFGITDVNGNGVILSDHGKSIFHFFLSKHMANAALEAVVSANIDAPELKVTAFHLGKCWFKLINSSGSKEFRLQKYGGDNEAEIKKPVHFRLVPNMKDLLGARILTGLKPGDFEQLKDAVDVPDTQKALSIIRKASTESNGFTDPFNQIPVFTISQMRVRKKDEDGNPVGKAMLPMHLSTKTMSDSWNEFISQSPQFQKSEATLQLIELHKMIEMMQNDSEIDFRNFVFIHPSFDKDGPNAEESDDEDSDDDEGGGGDNGMKREAGGYDQSSIEPFVSMEIFTSGTGSGQSLVQL